MMTKVPKSRKRLKWSSWIAREAGYPRSMMCDECDRKYMDYKPYPDVSICPKFGCIGKEKV